MKSGAENRKKTITAGVLGAVALVCAFVIYNSLFSGPDTPPPTVAPLSKAPAPAPTAAAAKTQAQAAAAGVLIAPGVAATKLASTSQGLDPTLDEVSMLRTESLQYSGMGRNIFSATYTPPVVLPTNVPKARPGPVMPVVPPPPPPPPPTCPPTCPPINLKFFGVEKFANGALEGFFLSGEDVYMAREGDIVARKYKVVSLRSTSASVEDLQNTNTQTLAMQQQ